MKAVVPIFVALSALSGVVHGTMKHKKEETLLASWRESNVPEETGPVRGPNAAAAHALTVRAEAELDSQLEEAVIAIRQADFLRALAITREVDQKIGPAAFSPGGRALLKRNAQTAAKARLFRALTRQIEPHNFLQGDHMQLRVVQLADGDEAFVARLVRNDEDGVVLQFEDGTEQLFATREVTAIEPITTDVYRSRVRGFVETRHSEAADAKPLDLYRLAFTCFQNELTTRGVELLDEAVHRPGAEVLAYFGDGDEMAMLEAISIITGRTIGSIDPDALLAAAEAAARPTPTPERPVRPESTGGGGGDPIEPIPVEPRPIPVDTGPSVTDEPEFAKARELFEKAMDHYRLYLQGPTSGRGQKNCRAARDLLDRAMEIYTRLSMTYSDDLELDREAQSTQQLLYDCQKGLKVD